MYLILLLSIFFSGSNPTAGPFVICEPTGVTVQISTVKAIIVYDNIIKVKLDTVMGDSLSLSVIESFKGDLRQSTSITVPKRLLTGRLYPPKFITLENEFDTLGSIPIPRRRIIYPELVENSIDTFVVIGAKKASRGYYLSHVYALSSNKAYAYTPFDREYGGSYKKVKHLDDPETLQQVIKAVVAHTGSSGSGISTVGVDYKQYIDEFLKKFEEVNAVNTSLRFNGLEDLLLFDLNKVFGTLPIKDKIEMSAYSEQLIRKEFPQAKKYYSSGITDMNIASTEDLEDAVKLFPNLVPKTRTFNQVKGIIFHAILGNKAIEVRKKTIRKFLRAIDKAGDEDGDNEYFREQLNAFLQ